jgi:hypothetical protein
MPLKGLSKPQVIAAELHRYKAGTLHSGSPKGPVVRSRGQALAIALSEAKRGKR